MLRAFLLVFLIAVLGAPGWPQTQPQAASLTFAFDFPGSMPDRYAIRIKSDGKGEYESRSKLSSESDDEDSFHYGFSVSPAVRQKMFDLAVRAHYFQTDLDSHRKGMAFTGKKMLSYRDSQRSGEATYNFSSNPAVQELTSLFQSLSATLEFGHRLEYDHRYQKTALDEELKRLEQTVRSNLVIEISVIAPVLQQIVDDSSVMNVSRARAQRVLQKAGNP